MYMYKNNLIENLIIIINLCLICCNYNYYQYDIIIVLVCIVNSRKLENVWADNILFRFDDIACAQLCMHIHINNK